MISLNSVILNSLRSCPKRPCQLASRAYSKAPQGAAAVATQVNRERTGQNTTPAVHRVESLYVPRCRPPESKVQLKSPYDRMEKHVLDIVEHGMGAASASRLVRENMRVVNNMLYVRDRRYHLYRNVHVVAIGKAVLGMTRAVDELLADHVLRGIAIVPKGTLERASSVENELAKLAGEGHDHPRFLLRSDSRIRVHEAAPRNIPDEAAIQASKEVRDLAESLNENDILIVLITGGGSALLTLPVEPITLEEMKSVTHLLNLRGANAYDINGVRKQLSQLKGGRLAELAYPAKVIAFVLSDVVGDAIEYIASGPTVIDTSASASHAVDIIRHYDLLNRMPKNAMAYLEQKVAQESSAAEVSGLKAHSSASSLLDFSGDDSRSTQNATVVNTMNEAREARLSMMQYNVQNVVIGNNRIALEGAAQHARSELGYVPYILSSRIGGTVDNAAQLFSKLCLFLHCWYGLELERGLSSSTPLSQLSTSNQDRKTEIKHDETSVSVDQIANFDEFVRSLRKRESESVSVSDASFTTDSVCERSEQQARTLTLTEFELVRCGVRKEQLNELLRVAKQAFLLGRPLCILAGGELTVDFKESDADSKREIGEGGRCMHLSTLMAKRLHDFQRSTKAANWLGKSQLAFQFCAVGTDGQDGPTPGAGAYVNASTLNEGGDDESVVRECDKAIENFDSFNWLKNYADGRYLLQYAYTDSNVMDLFALLVTRPEA